ncbi:MAG: hypothetical protein IPG59_05485 [Candidatus Melainabacteria bacterium]|nr:MAG: hypothetical protein IPG59_05485 [Candidatus Melainabacteria bacterium]
MEPNAVHPQIARTKMKAIQHKKLSSFFAKKTSISAVTISITIGAATTSEVRCLCACTYGMNASLPVLAKSG